MFEWLRTLWGAVFYDDTLLFEIHNSDFIMVPALILCIVIARKMFCRKSCKKTRLSECEIYKAMRRENDVQNHNTW